MFGVRIMSLADITLPNSSLKTISFKSPNVAHTTKYVSKVCLVMTDHETHESPNLIDLFFCGHLGGTVKGCWTLNHTHLDT